MITRVSVPMLTTLNKIDEIRCWENRPFTTIWPEPQQKKTTGITRVIKKKHKRQRTAFTTQQLKMMEETYFKHKYLHAELRQDLAKALNIEEKCIKVWFQNRRMKEKREIHEVSNDSSSVDLQAGNSSHLPSEQFEQYTTDYKPTHNIYESPNILPNYNSYYCNQDKMQNYNYHSAQTASNNTMFYCDNNAYPTQYYPDYYVQNTSVDQCNVESNEFHNYWSESNVTGSI